MCRGPWYGWCVMGILMLAAQASGQSEDPPDVFSGEFGRCVALAASQSAELRLTAVQGFSWLKHSSAEPHLIALARDADPAVRREAAFALGRVGRRDSIPALMAMLRDSDVGAAQQARASLQRLTQRPDPSQEWWQSTSADAYEADLIERLKQPDAPSRLAALRALRCFGTARAEQPAQQLLSADPRPDPEQVLAIIEVLERVGTQASLPWLCQVVEIVPDACWALANLGGAQAEEALIKAAQRHWDYGSNPQLLINLDRLHSTRCGPLVAALVYSFGCISFRGQPEDLAYDPTPGQRAAANLIIRSGRGPEVVDLVLREMEGCGVDAEIPADLKDQIVRLREELLPGFVRNDGVTTSQPMCAMSHVIRDRRLAPRLVPLLRHPAYVARVYAAEALCRLGAVEALPEIAALVEEGYPFPDATTLTSGKHFGDSQAARYKGFLCMALGHLGGDGARLALERWCSDPDQFRDIRYGSVVGLRFLGSPESLPTLHEVADEDIIWRIREEAKSAIRDIERGA